MRFLLGTLFIAVVLSDCGGMATTAGGGNSDQITSELLRAADSEGLTVYQLVERHRPRWLRASRGFPSLGGAAGGNTLAAPVRVVLDGVPYGEIDDLRRLNVTEVEDLEYMSASRRDNAIRDRLHGRSHSRSYSLTGAVRGVPPRPVDVPPRGTTRCCSGGRMVLKPRTRRSGTPVSNALGRGCSHESSRIQFVVERGGLAGARICLNQDMVAARRHG